MTKKVLVPLLMVVSLACATNAACATLLPDRIARAAGERVDAGEYPALAIGYVDGGKTQVSVFGKLDGQATLDADTVFEIGSITKTFTATVLAQDVRDGALTLGMPVATLLPGFKIPAHDGKEISLLDLATQFSGLPRLPTNMAPADSANPYADYGAAKLKEFLTGYELPRAPGSSYEYSNLGFGLLGFALAQHAHATYGDLLERRIFRPLKMTMSGTAVSERMRSHLAAGHGDNGAPAKNWTFDALAGAGAVLSTAGDMLNYLRMNMGSLEMPGGSTNDIAHETRRDVGNGEHIGLAWMIRPDKHGDVIWHNGATGGYRSFLGFDNHGQRGIVILANGTSSVDDLGFAALLDDAPLVSAHRAVSVDAASLDDFVGDYKLSDAVSINISRKDTQLFAQATGQGAFPIFADATGIFFAKVADIRFSFTRDARGRVSALTLHQNGDHAARKFGAADAGSMPIDAGALREYVGRYRIAPGTEIVMALKDDRLFTQLTGQPAYPVYASAKDKFFLRVVDAQLDFERDAGGKIEALVLHQNGMNLRAEIVTP